jgi:hypothetical protein
MYEVMKEEYKKMVIEFPKDSDDFLEGIILLDEAVGRFARCVGDDRAALIESLLVAIVMSHAGEEREECECCCK